jgi:hypothetical protein
VRFGRSAARDYAAEARRILRGHDVVVRWCPLDQRGHVGVLLEVANR